LYNQRKVSKLMNLMNQLLVTHPEFVGSRVLATTLMKSLCSGNPVVLDQDYKASH